MSTSLHPQATATISSRMPSPRTAWAVSPSAGSHAGEHPVLEPMEKRLETDTSRGKFSAGGGMDDFQVGGAHPAASLLFLSVPVTRGLPTQPSSPLAENPGQLTSLLLASIFSPVKWRNNTSLIR